MFRLIGASRLFTCRCLGKMSIGFRGLFCEDEFPELAVVVGGAHHRVLDVPVFG